MKQQSKTIQKKAFIGILCSVILIFLDQFTKYLAVQHLKDQMPVVLWKNVLELSYLENRGAAFGIFQGKQWPLIIFTVIVLILIIYFYLMRIPSEKHFGLLNGIAILFFAGAILFQTDQFPGFQRRRHLCDRCCRTFDLMSAVL